HERSSEALLVALRRDQSPGAPCPVDLESLERHANRQRLVVADDGGPFARDPDAGLTRRVVRIAAMLPVPPESIGFSGIGTMRASIQRIENATVLCPEAIDIRHEAIVQTCYAECRTQNAGSNRNAESGSGTRLENQGCRMQTLDDVGILQPEI